jgi:hypothetical protein
MKAFLRGQLQPVKTMRQMISDRCLYRTLAIALLILNWCF